MKTVLELSTTKAMDYFLQPSNYTTIAFPIYFSFKEIIDFVKTKIGRKDFGACLKDSKKIHLIMIK
ncbi:hypothetical protein [uncultured Alistipes sp.]|uniref:hypothetical protein n=1 Tax=uncultured Alistipes sp. TaxID=538949 RepID=UPI00259A7B2F|nr:hypothetical protein [uncultured Alistipes sp.]